MFPEGPCTKLWSPSPRSDEPFVFKSLNIWKQILTCPSNTKNNNEYTNKPNNKSSKTRKQDNPYIAKHKPKEPPPAATPEAFDLATGSWVSRRGFSLRRELGWPGCCCCCSCCCCWLLLLAVLVVLVLVLVFFLVGVSRLAA